MVKPHLKIKWYKSSTSVTTTASTLMRVNSTTLFNTNFKFEGEKKRKEKENTTHQNGGKLIHKKIKIAKILKL